MGKMYHISENGDMNFLLDSILMISFAYCQLLEEESRIKKETLKLTFFNYRHLDHHKLWDPNEFAVHCFKIIMYSIQVRIG